MILPILRTARLVLRRLEPGDAAALYRLAAERDIAATTLNIPHPYPAGGAEEFIHLSHELLARGRVATFGIIHDATQVLIGVVSLSIRAEDHAAELGYWVGKPYWGQGYMTEAARAVLTFGFETLRLHRIYATAFTGNGASQSVMQKVGMTCEGTLKQHVLKWGRCEDLAVYSILRAEHGA